MNRFYTNKIGCGIAEMSRITFYETDPNGDQIEISTAIMHVEVFRNLINVMQQTIDQYDMNVKNAEKERNRLS